MFNTYALSDGTLMITGYTGWEAEITIPGEINGTAVTVIGESAFDGCGILTSVTIPESVTDIRGIAFFRCSNLASVVIPGSVTIIGERAFYDCDSLTSIAIPAGVTEIGNSAFRYCDSLTEIQVDGNNPYYASVGGVLFNKSVTDLITCPAGYEGSYSIPMGVTSIGDNAFDGCGSLTGVTIPDSVTNIGWAAFYRCTSLTGIQVDGNNPSYASVGGVLFNKSRTSLIVCPAGFEGSYSIPMGVTSINTSAFGFCNSLTGVTIPASVTGISWDAFVNCWALTDVYYTGSEEQWNAMNILDGNDALIDATIHFNYVPEQVFTAVLTLPASLTEIEEEAFAGLTNIEMVVLPDTCMTIGARAFAGCTNLQVVVMPEGVSIGDGAFDGCPYVRFISGGDDDIAE